METRARIPRNLGVFERILVFVPDFDPCRKAIALVDPWEETPHLGNPLALSSSNTLSRADFGNSINRSVLYLDAPDLAWIAIFRAT